MMARKLISLCFHALVHLLSYTVPKTKRIWVYGEWFGNTFVDNSSYAYRAQPRKSIKKVWITKNRTIVNELRRKGLHVYYAYSFRGIWCQLRAKVFFCTVNSRDFCFSCLTRRNIIFQIWHGLPLKKIGFDVKGRSFVQLCIDHARACLTDHYAFVVSPSSHFDEFFRSAFLISPRRILRSGYPRCDALLHSNNDVDDIRTKLRVRTSRLAFYLPTHRKEGAAPEILQGLIADMQSLEATCEKLDLTIVIKPHFYEKGPFGCARNGLVRVVETLPVELYRALAISDCLISDYSSVSLDYAITGRPLIFFVPDMDDYLENDRDSYMDLKAVLKGAPRDREGLKHALTEAFSEGYVSPRLWDISGPQNGSFSDDLQVAAERLVFGGN